MFPYGFYLYEFALQLSECIEVEKHHVGGGCRSPGRHPSGSMVGTIPFPRIVLCSLNTV